MEKVLSLEEIKTPVNGTSVALGTFDGIHIGHQAVIGKAINLAKQNKTCGAVFTFKQHPLQLLNSTESPKLILNLDDKVQKIKEQGTELLVMVDFTPQIANLEPEDFVKNILVEKLNVRNVVVGENYFFGRKASADANELIRYGEKYGFTVSIISPVKIRNEAVSSTEIRKLISKGLVEKVKFFLGYFPFLTGKVIVGDARGRLLGFRTANLAFSPEVVLPAIGVYLVNVYYENTRYEGIINIGRRPTFDKTILSPEVHIFDFDDDIYGKDLKVEFLHYLRGEVKFKNAGELTARIKDDIVAARRFFAEFSSFSVYNGNKLC